MASAEVEDVLLPPDAGLLGAAGGVQPEGLDARALLLLEKQRNVEADPAGDSAGWSPWWDRSSDGTAAGAAGSDNPTVCGWDLVYSQSGGSASQKGSSLTVTG